MGRKTELIKEAQQIIGALRKDTQFHDPTPDQINEWWDEAQDVVGTAAPPKTQAEIEADREMEAKVQAYIRLHALPHQLEMLQQMKELHELIERKTEV